MTLAWKEEDHIANIKLLELFMKFFFVAGVTFEKNPDKSEQRTIKIDLQILPPVIEGKHCNYTLLYAMQWLSTPNRATNGLPMELQSRFILNGMVSKNKRII